MLIAGQRITPRLLHAGLLSGSCRSWKASYHIFTQNTKVVIPGTRLLQRPAAVLMPAAPLSGQATWDGKGSQHDLMHKDECILVDGADKVVGHANKYSSHRFQAGQPQGLLHRAFSVFLFNSDNQLLLQQRAKSKITFPGVWTNTCCSHPLHGHSPSEVDSPKDIASGSVPGAKRAAIRKLHHELGIAPDTLAVEDFKYLTRLHYCAADTTTWGPRAEWGEHEIDYILLAQADGVQLQPNAEEVADVRWVSAQELWRMMDAKSGLMWSPWFRIIAENFLDAWWQDLPAALATDKHVDLERIHKLT